MIFSGLPVETLEVAETIWSNKNRILDRKTMSVFLEKELNSKKIAKSMALGAIEVLIGRAESEILEFEKIIKCNDNVHPQGVPFLSDLRRNRDDLLTVRSILSESSPIAGKWERCRRHS